MRAFDTLQVTWISQSVTSIPHFRDFSATQAQLLILFLEYLIASSEAGVRRTRAYLSRALVAPSDHPREEPLQRTVPCVQARTHAQTISSAGGASILFRVRKVAIVPKAQRGKHLAQLVGLVEETPHYMICQLQIQHAKCACRVHGRMVHSMRCSALFALRATYALVVRAHRHHRI